MSIEPNTEELARAAADVLCLDPLSLKFSRCPSGKYNSSWFVEGCERAVVVRVAPPDERGTNLFYEYRMMRQEPGLHSLIAGRTRMPVPKVLAWDFGHTRLDRDFLILERCGGAPVSDYPAISRRDWECALGELGAALREVHALHGECYGYDGPHHPMEPQSDWTSAFVVMWNELLNDILRSGGYGVRETDALRRLLDIHLDAFTRSGPASLLHMDIWAQNILIQPGGKLTCLLDWDRALWGDPEIEFAVLDYCGISEPAFWEGYAERRVNDREAVTRRVFYLLYELQKYIFIRRVRGSNPALADTYRQQSLALAGQLGLRL